MMIRFKTLQQLKMSKCAIETDVQRFNQHLQEGLIGLQNCFEAKARFSLLYYDKLWVLVRLSYPRLWKETKLLSTLSNIIFN